MTAVPVLALSTLNCTLATAAPALAHVASMTIDGIAVPALLDFSIRLTDTLSYPAYRVAVSLACIAVAWVWFGDALAGVKNAVLVLGTCLATPYLQDYDLVFGALVVAWLWQCPVPDASDGVLHVSAGLLLLLPLVAAALAKLTGLALGPLFIAPLFIVALQRSFGAWRAGLALLQRSRGLLG